MIVQCGHCGAPLDVKESATIIKCRYCGTSNERASVRTIAERTPEDFEPPKKWTPPAEFAASSSDELTYRRSGGWILGTIIALVVLTPLVIGGGSCIEDATGFLDTEPSRLAKRTALDGDVTTLASAFGGSASDTSVNVPLHSAIYARLSLSYDDKSPDHPTSFVFLRRHEKTPCDPQVLAKLSKLTGGVDASGSWSWAHVGISCNSESGAVSAYVHIDNNPLWRKQLDAAWKVVLGATFGFDIAPTHAEMLDLLGAGYPFASIENISPLTPIDVAAATVQKQFPGATLLTQGEVNATIPVDHPVFRAVKLRWLNARGASLYSVDFSPVGDQKGFASKRDAFATCMSNALGAARVSDADYMTKTKAYAWSLPSMSIDLHESGLSISTSGQTLDAAAYATAIHAIAACH